MRTIAKRATIFILVGTMVWGLVACGTNGATSDNADNSQDSSTPAVTEPVDASNQTQEVEETIPDTAETTPVSQEETQQEMQPTAQSQEETPVPEEVGPKFTEVNETVYATTSVNVRASYSADSDKVGSLSAGASATRTGVGDNGWSRIVYGDSVAYVSSDYLSTTKPMIAKPSTSTPSTSTQSTSTPSTSTPGTSTPSTSTPADNGDNGAGNSNGFNVDDIQEWSESVGGTYDPESGMGWLP